MNDAAHYLYSSSREKLLEHLFVGDLLRCLWREGIHEPEVLKAEVDNTGYDLVLDCKGLMRHVQLKSSRRQAKTSSVNVSMKLVSKPSGCVIWVWFDPKTLELGPFLWFGGKPGEPLPHLGDRIAKHTKGDSTGRKAERANIRVLTKAKFETVPKIEDVARLLFG